MNDEEVSTLIDRIILGKNIFTIENIKYYLINPNIEIKIKSNLIYEKIYEENLYDSSFVDPDRLDFMLKLNGIIPSDYDKVVKKLEKDIESYAAQIFNV